MSILQTAAYEEEIGGIRRRLVLRNGEIERFEAQYPDFGIFEFWDQLFGRSKPPRAGHCRDLVALGLVGGGMSDRAAEDLIASQGPEQNLFLRGVAQRLLGVTFLPAVLDAETPGRSKKNAAGSRRRSGKPPSDMTPEEKSETSAA
jgi:hypothetical protein